MPTLKDNITITAEIDFEVVCDECGTGLCSSTRVKGNYAYVSVCPKCMAQKDYEIDELKATIEQLEDKIYKLENQ